MVTMKIFLSAAALTLLQAVKSASATLTMGSFELPQGTYPEHATTETQNRDGGVTKTYSFPEAPGWKMASERGLSLAGKFSCKCGKGWGSCYEDESGSCYIGAGCEYCVPTISAVTIREGGSVGFLGSEEDLARNLPSTDGRLFDLEMVSSAVKGFNEEFGDSLVMDDDYCPESKETGVCEAKPGHTFVAVDVFGSTTYVPAKLSGMRAIGASAISVGKLSCSCNTSGSCPMDSTWGHKYCDAGSCQSCTMHGTAISMKERERISAEKELFH